MRSPPGWYVGTPMFNKRRDQWSIYGYDTTERVRIGKRRREWTAVGNTDEDCVREMARCLRLIAAGEVPI